jgi:hypothetical protein
MSVTAVNGTHHIVHSDAVDLYNSASGTWSTARLSVSRTQLAATSVGNVALFAGGYEGNCRFALCHCGFALVLLCVFEAFRRLLACVCASAIHRLTRVTAGYLDESKVVDLYNSASGTWSTAQLSLGGTDLVATSVGNLAIFAGGGRSNCSFAMCYVYIWFVLELLCVNDARLRRFVDCFLVVALQVAISSVQLQLSENALLWSCTTAHRAHGRLLGSVLFAVDLQRYLLGSWPSSLAVFYQVVASALRCVLEGFCVESV